MNKGAGVRQYRYLNLITAVYVTCLITANIIAVKLVAVGGIVAPAAVIIFPVSYIFGDVLTEVYGYSRSRQVIWVGFGCNAMAVAAIMIAQALPAAPFWDAQAQFERILGVAPRLLAASFAAYLVGEFLNAIVLAKMKIATRGRWLWMRTLGSTILGQGADSLIFVTLAYMGSVTADQIIQVVLTLWLLKSCFEALATPLTYVVVGFLKRREKEDYYDYGTDFNPFRAKG